MVSFWNFFKHVICFTMCNLILLLCLIVSQLTDPKISISDICSNIVRRPIASIRSCLSNTSQPVYRSYQRLIKAYLKEPKQSEP